MRYPSAFEAMTVVRERSDLVSLIEKCYLHPLGPGSLPKLNPKGPRRIRGGIVPHAGYEYSGPVAAHVYGALASDGFPEVFVIFGGDHVGYSKAVVTTQDFQTSLGIAKVDRDLAKAIGLEENPDVHADEHAIGMQLPFLLHISPKIKFVPVYVPSSSLKTARETGERVAAAVENRDVVIIASSDFMHAGFSYGHPPPPDMNAGEFARKQDELAIKQILNLSPEGLWKTVREHRISMCGVGAVTALLFALRSAKSATLLKHATSYDVSPGSDAVGYAAVVLE